MNHHAGSADKLKRFPAIIGGVKLRAIIKGSAIMNLTLVIHIASGQITLPVAAVPLAMSFSMTAALVLAFAVALSVAAFVLAFSVALSVAAFVFALAVTLSMTAALMLVLIQMLLILRCNSHCSLLLYYICIIGFKLFVF